MNFHQVLIVGAGPSGMATALQLKRYGVDYILFEKHKAGGLLHNANLVENYPGFPGGIPGPQLVRLFEDQLDSTGVTVTSEEVKSLDYLGGKFHFITSQNEYESAIAVVASGTQPRPFTRLEIPEALQSQVSYEVASLLHLRDKRIAIVGAGDAAFDYALNLGKTNQIIILNRNQNVKCLPLLWERVQSSQTIRYLAEVEILSVEVGRQGEMNIIHTSKSGPTLLQIDYLIGALGREVCHGYLTPGLEKQASDLEKQGMLYFIGDVKNKHYRQTAIAVGDGILAAMRIYEVLRAGWV